MSESHSAALVVRSKAEPLMEALGLGGGKPLVIHIPFGRWDGPGRRDFRLPLEGEDFEE